MKDLVEDLFEEDPPIAGEPKEIITCLGKYGVRNLAYDGDIGCNPGYIFRGEAAFDFPLQSSLERSLRKKLGASALIDCEMLRTEEVLVLTTFVEGSCGRVATIFHPDGKVSRHHPKMDVFWWLSLMQHYNDEHQGTPTRLLDFTRDIRLALYFAIEQHESHLKWHHEEKDLIIYCAPCKDLRFQDDPDINKCPFRFSADLRAINMNVAIGCLMKIPWMGAAEHALFEVHLKNRNGQHWGWDMPYHQNPRLKSQRGMFIYPYDYPQENSPLTATTPSWFIQNLARKTTNQFNLGDSSRTWPAKRIRIPSRFAKEVKEHLDKEYQIGTGTIYERYTL